MSLAFDSISFLLGAAAALLVFLLILFWLLPRARRQGEQSREAERTELRGELDLLRAEHQSNRERTERLLSEHAGLSSRAESLAERNRELDQALSSAREQGDLMRGQLADLRSRSEERLRAADEKLAAFKQMQEQLLPQFENLSNRLLEEKTQSLKQHSIEQIGGLLNPLRERLEGFQKQVADSYGNERVERQSLKLEIEQLKRLNERLGDEADSLSKALRGEQRIQGDWGEMVLERVLEASGLSAGRDYDTQQTLHDSDGSRWRPDVVVHLPEARDLIIDAKVSLTAYARASNAGDEASSAISMREHLDSLRNHIRELANRDYSRLPGVRSPDFVLMFVPVEPALLDALRADPELQGFALKLNVTLVGPSTLLLALRTVANLWRLEKQNLNAQKIADRAARLYDKFVGFVADMQGIEKNLRQAQGAYDAAFGKLSTGHGNLMRQAEMLEKLGAKPSKALPSDLTDPDDFDDDEDDNEELGEVSAAPRLPKAGSDPNDD